MRGGAGVVTADSWRIVALYDRRSVTRETRMLLQGLKVVEMSTWIAAPGAAMIMGEWGADVIKVESTEGDAIRRFYPDTPETPGNPIFSMENRGKRSVVLDIYSP